MKHIQTFERFSVEEITNEESLKDIFKSSDQKGYVVSTQGSNFKTYVEQGLKLSAYTKPGISKDEKVSLTDLFKTDFLKFAELIESSNFEFKKVKEGSMKDEKLKKVFDYICTRGYDSAKKKATTHGFGSGEGSTVTFDVNKNFNPVADVQSIKFDRNK